MRGKTIQKAKISTQELCGTAIMTAVTAVMAQISIPMPFMVPFTMQTFAVTLAGIILGAKKGAVSMLIYLLLGAAGAPVFAGFGGGLQNIVGPTGGFLLSFPLMAYLIGLGVQMKNKRGMFILFLILGTLSNYVAGVAVYCLVMNSSVATAVAACVLPFLPTAVIKAAAASVLGLRIRRRLGAAVQWS